MSDGPPGSTANDRHVNLNNGEIVARTWNNESIQSSGLDLADGNWHHVAHVFAQGVHGQRLYVDGQLVAQGTKDASDFTTETRILIGYSIDAVSRFFDGWIDEVAIFDRALTTTEIFEQYLSALVPVFDQRGRLRAVDGDGDGRRVVDGGAVERSVLGDLDDDQVIGCSDVDALVNAIATQSHDEALDLTNDSVVTREDLDRWVAEIFNTLPGDADLNRVVDGDDLAIWRNNAFSGGNGWCRADFNADGGTDGSDFNLWNSQRFMSADNAQAEVAAMPRTPRAAHADEVLVVIASESVLPTSEATVKTERVTMDSTSTDGPRDATWARWDDAVIPRAKRSNRTWSSRLVDDRPDREDALRHDALIDDFFKELA